jgi:hypothetical protein
MELVVHLSSTLPTSGVGPVKVAHPCYDIDQSAHFWVEWITSRAIGEVLNPTHFYGDLHQ